MITDSAFTRIEVEELVPTDIPRKGSDNLVLWDFKHTKKQLKVLEEGDPHIYAAQYEQAPSRPDGNMFKDKYWRHYEELPRDFNLVVIYGDTAQKAKEHNDYTVFQCWGRNMTGIYLIDQVRGKWEAPQLESSLVEFYEKHRPNTFKPVGANLVKIEDKSSGSSLIQTIEQDYLIPIQGIQRNTDKVLRAHGVVSHLAAGHVYLPKHVEWLHDYKQEFREFTPLMNHKHDDQVDATIDAIEDMLVNNQLLYTQENVNQ